MPVANDASTFWRSCLVRSSEARCSPSRRIWIYRRISSSGVNAGWSRHVGARRVRRRSVSQGCSSPALEAKPGMVLASHALSRSTLSNRHAGSSGARVAFVHEKRSQAFGGRRDGAAPGRDRRAFHLFCCLFNMRAYAPRLRFGAVSSRWTGPRCPVRDGPVTRMCFPRTCSIQEKGRNDFPAIIS